MDILITVKKLKDYLDMFPDDTIVMTKGRDKDNNVVYGNVVLPKNRETMFRPNHTLTIKGDDMYISSSRTTIIDGDKINIDVVLLKFIPTI